MNLALISSVQGGCEEGGVQLFIFRCRSKSLLSRAAGSVYTVTWALLQQQQGQEPKETGASGGHCLQESEAVHLG